MQRKTRAQTLSCLRQELLHLMDELERSLEVVFGRDPLVKGNVYEMARKCGKPSLCLYSGEVAPKHGLELEPPWEDQAYIDSSGEA